MIPFTYLSIHCQHIFLSTYVFDAHCSKSVWVGIDTISGDGLSAEGAIGLPDFDHKNLAEWLYKRNATTNNTNATLPLNTEYVSLLRKCEWFFPSQ